MADVNVNFSVTGWEGLMDKFKKLDLSSAKIGVAAGAAGFAIGVTIKKVVDMTFAVADQADKMKELGEKFGITTEAASKFAYVAQVQGMNVESLGRTFGLLNKEIMAAVDGKEKSIAKFEKLGIAFKDTEGNARGVEQVMIDLADKVAGAATPAEALNIATQVLGRSAQRLMPILSEGGESIKRMFKDAEESGNVFTTKQGQDADRLKENIERLKLIFSGFTKQALLPLVGEFAKLSEKLLAVMKDTGAVQKGMVGLTAVFKVVVTAISIISRAFDALGKSIGAVAAALMSLAEGEFRQAYRIMKENVLDLSDVFKGLKKDLDDIWKDSDKSAGGLKKMSMALRGVGNDYRFLKAAMGGQSGIPGPSASEAGIPTYEQWDDLMDEVRGFGSDFTRETARFLSRSEKNWEDYFRRIGEFAAELVLHQVVTKPLEGFLNRLVGGFLGNVLGGGSGATGGAGGGGGTYSAPVYEAAGGGRIPPGRGAIVGEEGPEFISASGGGRWVQPNGAMGGGGGNQIHFHFAAGVTQADLAAVIPAIRAQAVAAVVDIQRRGGRM